MKKSMMLAVGSLMAAAVASAHTGATGIVLERMNGMSAMQDVVRNLTPMMQGQTAYNRQAVIDAAGILESHAGETMTALFPEGSDPEVSYVSPAIWEDWEGFEELAMRLEVVAGAMALAADNPPGSEMPGAGEQADAGAMMGGASSMMGGTAEPDAAALAQMPVDRVFAAAAQTCSACHTAYRIERED